jgi:hypothetical protein
MEASAAGAHYHVFHNAFLAKWDATGSKATGQVWAQQGEQAMTTASKEAKPGTVDMKLEVVVIPTSDLERAKRFYRTW